MSLAKMDPMDLNFRAKSRSSFFKPVKLGALLHAKKMIGGRELPHKVVASDDTMAPDTIYPLW